MLIAAVSLLTTACLADIDATGRWVIRGPYVLGTYVVADDWVQSGTGLTTSSGYSGTIASTAGTFSMTRPGPPLCGTDTRTGTFAADGQSWIGTEHIHPSSSPTACLNGIEFPVTGSRCPNGSIEFGEECDDGNVVDGDGCDNLCALEACWSCTGEPSACAPVAACACPSGTIEAAEECDDGNSLDGDGCDNTCAIEPCWSCAGVPSVCASLPFGTACDAGDGVACTTGGTCDGAQHCVETPTVGLCDDGNACTLEACDPLVGCVHAPNPCDDGDPCTSDQCVTDCTHSPRVRTDCRTASLSRLLLKSTAAGDRDKLTWTWARGESTSQAEFADPRADAHYEFCVFAGAANVTVGAAHVPPDPSRWQPSARGFTYRSPAADGDGITSLKLVGDDANRSTIKLKGHGALLDLTPPPAAVPITAQLVNSGSNVCWSATYEAADIRRNDAGTLGAVSTGP